MKKPALCVIALIMMTAAFVARADEPTRNMFVWAASLQGNSQRPYSVHGLAMDGDICSIDISAEEIPQPHYNELRLKVSVTKRAIALQPNVFSPTSLSPSVGHWILEALRVGQDVVTYSAHDVVADGQRYGFSLPQTPVAEDRRVEWFVRPQDHQVFAARVVMPVDKVSRPVDCMFKPSADRS